MPAWQALEQHRAALADVHLRRLLEEDTGRFERLSASGGGILLDYSKQIVTSDTMRLLFALARDCGLELQIERLFSAARVNTTENRPALHMALRAARPMMLDGADVTREVAAVLRQMRRLATAVRSGRARGATGRAFTDVVNIGIGGSDLGPRMVCDALARDARSRLRMHFVSNVDGAAITSVLDALDASTTLVIIASKTFTTAETLENANTARAWLARRLRGKGAITLDQERLRARRVIAVLEQAGTPDAQELLASLSRGAAEPDLRWTAGDAVRRLKKLQPAEGQ